MGINRRTPYVARGFHRWQRRVFRELYKRRIEQGPEVERRRSEWLNWNYDSELYAFGRRLGEDFDEESLRAAFTHRCHVEHEAEQRADLGMDKGSLEIHDNEELSAAGDEICCDYMRGYLRHYFPLLPEEGVCAVSDHLLSDDMLAYIASNIGIKDLVLSTDFPASNATLSKTLKAVVGALALHKGVRAQLFVQDFILTQLVGKNLMSLWNVVNPMGLLEAVLASKGMAEPESRLLWETGRETVVAAYVVGIYSNKELVGKAPGETVSIAEEMAARDALQRLFRITDDRAPFVFGDAASLPAINTTSQNTSITEYFTAQTSASQRIQ